MLNLPFYPTLRDKLKKYIFTLNSFWQSLNFAQRCYLIAIIVTIIYWEGEGHQIIISLLILAAVVSEFWPKFMQVWDSLPGKALILLFYSFVANYALVQASGMVNDITGVSADHLPYTHNFSVLLSVPIWFFITSLLVLLIIQIGIPFYIITLLLLRPFGLHTFWHAPGYRFPILTGIARFGAAFFLLTQLALLGSYTGVMGGINHTLKSVANGLEIDVNINGEPASKEKVAQAIQQDPELEDLRQLSDLNKQRSQSYDKRIKNILAYFIYENEADSRSRCEHTQGSRVIELNDYEILEIIKLENTQDETSYNYEVKPCISAAIGHQFKQSTQP